MIFSTLEQYMIKRFKYGSISSMLEYIYFIPNLLEVAYMVKNKT
jgi:hypothetical protein